MTNDELHALADAVNSIYAETYTQREAIDSVVAYLRAQADAQPVAWIKTTHAGVRRLEWNEQTHYANNDYPATTEPLYLRHAPQRQPESRPCTCHPDDNPPVPCAQKYALNECRATRSGPDEAQIEARDALLDFISENGTASEGVQHYLDRYVRAALAAKDNGNAGE